MRKYKSGTKWCIWRWTYVRSTLGQLYLKRLHLLKTPWFSIYLHWIYFQDHHVTKEGLPILHNHPVDFISIILRGNYKEISDYYFPNKQINIIKWFNWIPHYKKHYIFEVNPDYVLSLCLAGPVRQKWGYFVPNIKRQNFEFIPWDEFNDV